MSLSNTFIRLVKNFLPSPFSIAIFLTFATAILALLLTEPKADDSSMHLAQIAGFWEKGFWELLKFSMQMMLILVLGHVLALSKPINAMINSVLMLCKDTASSALVLSFLTICLALFNWGLGLVFGAIFARKIGEKFSAENKQLNYPLIGAAAYSGLMVWHGGFSGSAPLIISNSGHFLESSMGVIPISATIFSGMNIFASMLLLIGIPGLLYFLGKQKSESAFSLPAVEWEDEGMEKIEGAEKLDHSRWFAWLVGFAFLAVVLMKVYNLGIKVFSLDFINLLLFTLCILFHGSIHNFTSAAQKAIGGSVGIMLQFPLYAGIMGIMKYSGLIDVFSGFFVQISNSYTFPFFTFISAGIVNVFVPSGGGQWAVQGPIIVKAADQLNVAYPKCVMALAYGDQLTNMLQPFWALPLLGITGLKAKEILPYTFLLFLAGLVIFGLTLAIF